ncbi:MAG: ATP synthase F1 subunit gamma [Cytophagales bacterium]|nr:ATP synthase F1 subunit gamma [Cytophagales bacterium]
MANLKEVKNRISSVTSTQQITKAMKMVAAAKLRRAQERMMQMRPYAEKLTSIVNNVSSNSGDISSPFSEQREMAHVLLVVVSSDRGLCGGFNSGVFKHTAALIAEKYAGQEVTIFPLGKRSLEYFKKRNYTIIEEFSTVFEKLNFDNARESAEYVMSAFENKEFDQVEIIYNEFKNVATQIIQNEQFLPIKQDNEVEESASVTDYIYEPNQEQIFTEITPKSLKIQFYKTLLESNASEHGARMTAMDKATENADEMLKDLRLTYNRTRQAAITKEILEIVGGAEALSQA